MLRPAPVRVELASVRRGNLQVWIEEEARSRVRERHGVHAPVSGQLQRIEVVEGDRVTQGSVLARLDPALPAALDARSLSVQQAFVESAQAALASAQARLARARAAARQSARDLERSQALAERG
ncbi:MAG: biotin/lipoyl-binding protein, partial [Burkholderiales bacterium]